MQLFDEFVVRYNNERPHEGLDGRTPREQWATPLQTVSAERLRHLMLASGTRVVTKRGVRLESRTYNCPELCGYVGERVEVRYLPRHDEAVEIFIDSQHLGAAQLVDRLSH